MASGKSPEKSLANSFKRKLRQMLHSSPAIDTPIKKNVSWVDSNNDSKHERIYKRSTPHPNKTKPNVVTSQTLTFSESESDDENVINDSSFLTDISLIENDQKEKRLDLQSKWLVVEQDIKPDKYSNNWDEKDLLLSPEASVDSSEETTSNEDFSGLNGDDQDFVDSDSSSVDESFDPNRSLAKKIIEKIKELPTDNSDSPEEYSDSVESVYEDSDESNISDQNVLNDYSSDEFIPGGVNHRKLSILDESSSDDIISLPEPISNETISLPYLEQIAVVTNKKLPVLDDSSNESSNEITNELNLDKLFNPSLVKIDQCLIMEPGKIKTKRNSDSTPSSFSLSHSDNKPPNKITNKRKRIKRANKNKEKKLDSVEVPKTKSEKKKFKASSLNQTSPKRKSIENSPRLQNGNEDKIARLSFNDSDNIVESSNLETDNLNNDSLASEIDIYDIQNIVRYHIAPNYCILLLKHPIKLYFHGKLSMSVLSGACEILGHTLNFEHKKEIDIYSPRGNCFLCFETLPFKNNSNINAALKDYNMTDTQIEKLCTDLPDNYCIIAVKNIKNNMLTYLEKHVAQVLFPIIQNAYDSKRPLAELEYRLQCLFEIETRWWKVYNTHEDWAPLVDDMVLMTKEQSSRTLLCGGKSVGKSVLMRFMVNKMLNEVDKVVCIDLDPGQHEFTPPGCVSVTVVDAPVFGPNYSHLRTPVKCFFVGDVNIAQCLDRYVSSVKALMKYCDDNISKDLPWVINYMGFTRSLGTDLIISIIKLVAPSLVVQIESEFVNRNYASLLDQKYIQNYKSTVPIDTPNTKLNYNLKVLSSVADYKVAGEWEYEPRQIREMSILSYFSQMLEGNSEITACTPYAVKLSSVTLHHANYAKQNSPAVLNGNFVALCTIDDQEKLDSNTVVSCCGFGIVRGIDPDNNELYLLTPAEESRLESVNCLYMGNINIPPSVYMSAGHEGHVPYISMGVPKGISLIPKRNFRFIKSLLKK